MSNSARTLLTQLGVGQFNATMVIQYMFIPAATTDPKSPPIMLLVRTIQQRLSQLGYSVPHNGYLGDETAAALDAAVGRGWETLMWSDIVKGVLAGEPAQRPAARAVAPVGDFLPDLPSVPGGMLTYAAAGAAAYYFLVHKKRKR